MKAKGGDSNGYCNIGINNIILNRRKIENESEKQENPFYNDYYDISYNGFNVGMDNFRTCICGNRRKK